MAQKRMEELMRQEALPNGEAGLLMANGDTVPVDGTSGYQTGCYFAHTDGGDGTAAYINEGTVASCDFNAITVA